MAQGYSSIGTKLFWAIGVPGLIAAVAGVWLFWRQADAAVAESNQAEAEALAELFASSFAIAQQDPSAPHGTDAHSAHRAVTDLFRSRGRIVDNLRWASVTDGAGRIVWSRHGEDGSAPRAPTAGKDGSAQVVRHLGGAECTGCHANSQQLGTLSLSVQQPKLQAMVASVFGRALTGVLALFAVLLAVMVIALRVFLVRPLRRLTQVMRKAEEGDFLSRAPVTSRDELGALAEAFNRMLAKITSLRAQEIDTHRDLERAQQELVLKQALEATNESLEKRINEQSLLFDVARSLTSTLELDEIFARISTLVGERLKVPRFSIMLRRGDTLEVKSAWPRDAGTEGVTFAVGEGACGRAAQTQTSLYIPDLEKDAGIYIRRPEEQPPKGSLLAVPMIHKGEVLGVINLERPTPNGFAQNEIEVLSAVADLAAISTRNALLYEETVALSITDPLTGAANRRHMFARLELEVARALRYQTPLSVLMVDIDHFKHLNDTAGHRAGDAVLRQVCDVLRESTRKVDTLARYGGEEFLLILPQVAKAEALEAAEKLRRAVNEAPIEEGRGQPFGRVTISVGVAALHQDADALEALVDCADAALYASKRNGRNRATAYEPGMEAHPGRERGPLAAKRRRTGEVPSSTSSKGSA
ncbi:MAG: diguanylate cyclase [Myxococcaceae bacterium]|nr:diguanylate cyclase [Myxococcaceae bacterium]